MNKDKFKEISLIYNYMSHRIKNVTLEDGFAHNPNRIYFEEFFNTLPHQHKEFNFPSSAGNTDFTIYQPANTFLKEMYVVCTTAPLLSSAGNVGMSVSYGSTAVAVTFGTVVLGSTTNIISNHTTMASNSIAKIFPDSELTPSSGKVETSLGYSSSRRLLAIRVTTTQDASTVGTFKVIPVFANIDTSIHQFNPIYTLSGTGTPYVDFIDSANSDYVYGGMYLFTSATSGHQAIISPNSSSVHNALNCGVIKTGSRIEFQTSVIFPSIATDFSFFAGLKLTSDPTIATDTNQCMFCFGQSSPLDASLPSNTNFVFAYSIAGTDYMTNLGLPVVADREYHLKFVMDKNRKIKVFINGVQFGLSSTSGTYTATNSYDESAQMTNNVSVYPMLGLENTDSNSRSVVVNYIKCSRDAKKVST